MKLYSDSEDDKKSNQDNEKNYVSH